MIINIFMHTHIHPFPFFFSILVINHNGTLPVPPLYRLPPYMLLTLFRASTVLGTHFFLIFVLMELLGLPHVLLGTLQKDICKW